jgi:hypothetical protein
MAAVTIDIADSNRDFTATWVDSSGVEHKDIPAGYSPHWSTDDPGGLVTFQGNTVGGTANCNVRLVGLPGTFRLTVTFTKPGMPDIVGFDDVTITGLVPKSANVNLIPK